MVMAASWLLCAGMNASEKRQSLICTSATIGALQWGSIAVSAQTFSLEHLETPTGRLLVVTDAECRLRAVDWEDHHSRMRELLDRYYGAGTRLREARRPSQAAQALADYFAGDLEAIADLPTAANGTAFQLSV